MNSQASAAHNREIEQLLSKLKKGEPTKAGEQTLVSWKRDENAEDGLSGEANVSHVSTQISAAQASKIVRPQTEFRLFGIKLDMTEVRLAKLKEDYQKSAAGTISHNFIMAKFAEFRLNALGFMLSMAGVPPEEIEKIKKNAIAAAGQEAGEALRENEMNAELVQIVGGNKRAVKAQIAATTEVRTQLLSQLSNAGMGHLFTPRRMVEIRLELCQDIRSKFLAERDQLVYERDFYLGEKIS